MREEPLLFAAEADVAWCFAIAAWLIVLLAAALVLDRPQCLRARPLPARYHAAGTGALGDRPRRSWRVTALSLDQVFRVTRADGAMVVCRCRRTRRIARSLVSLTGGDDREEDAGWQFRPMLHLHLLQALWTWIAIGCFAASLLLGHEMMASGRTARGAFFYVFGVAFSIIFGVVLNWIFGLAPLFCIRNQVDASEALSLTLDFCTRQGGRLFGLSLAFLALRMVWVGTMFLFVLAPTSLGNRVAVGWILLIMGVMFLIYLAGADALCLARLGAYAALAEIDDQPKPEPESNPSPEPQSWAPHFPARERTQRAAGMKTSSYWVGASPYRMVSSMMATTSATVPVKPPTFAFTQAA